MEYAAEKKKRENLLLLFNWSVSYVWWSQRIPFHSDQKAEWQAWIETGQLHYDILTKKKKKGKHVHVVYSRAVNKENL